MTGPFGDGGVVGQAVEIGARGAPMSVEDRIETEALRRLHGAQRIARRRGDDQAGFIDLLDRVAQPRSRRRGAVARGGGDGARDQRFRGKARAPSWISTRSGACVACASRPARTLAWRVAPPKAGRPQSSRRSAERKRGDDFVITRAILGMNHNCRRAKIMRRRERLQRVAEQRPAGAEPVLLRFIAADARTAPGGDHDQGNFGRLRQGRLQGTDALSRFGRPASCDCHPSHNDPIETCRSTQRDLIRMCAQWKLRKR